MRISTTRLNKAVEIIKNEKFISKKGGKKGGPKIYYATQVAVNPITILMFVNKPELFEENYLRFVTNRLRTMLPIQEVPIRLLIRPRRAERSRGNPHRPN
jgi:GTP-binding protein